MPLIRRKLVAQHPSSERGGLERGPPQPWGPWVRRPPPRLPSLHRPKSSQEPPPQCSHAVRRRRNAYRKPVLPEAVGTRAATHDGAPTARELRQCLLRHLFRSTVVFTSAGGGFLRWYDKRVRLKNFRKYHFIFTITIFY